MPFPASARQTSLALMASMQMRRNRQLRELLQEEQEPFILEAYLLERVYSKNSSKSEPSKVLNKSASFHLRRIKKGVLHSSKLLKSAYKKLVLINKNCDDNKDGEMSNQATGSERFSSASSSTVYNSCPESDKEEASTSLHCQDHTLLPSDNSKSCDQRTDEALTDRKLRRRRMTESKKHSSVTAPEKTTEDSIVSAFWELLVCSTTDKPAWFQVAELLEFVHSNASSQWFKSKRALLQNQQLLFDCVRELIENNGRRKEYILGSEEIGKLICEKMKEWGKQSAKETSIHELLNLDFRESLDEWSDMKPQKSEFAIAVGDDILEELRNQLVIDMFSV